MGDGRWRRRVTSSVDKITPNVADTAHASSVLVDHAARREHQRVGNDAEGSVGGFREFACISL